MKNLLNLNSETLLPSLGIHRSHQIDYMPCLHIECVSCWCSIQSNLDELKDPCLGVRLAENNEDVSVKMEYKC